MPSRLSDVQIEKYKTELRIRGIVPTSPHDRHMTFKCLKCLHEWSSARGNVVSTGTGCPECSKVRVAEKNRSDPDKAAIQARKQGTIPIDPYETVDTRARFRCANCGHVWTTTWEVVLRGCGCPKCKTKRTRTKLLHDADDVYAQLAKGNIKALEPYDGSLKRIRFECTVCHHEWKAAPYTAVRMKSCPACGQKQRGIKRRLDDKTINERLKRQKLELAGQYHGAQYLTKFKCLRCTTVWEARAGSVVTHSLRRCPTCFPHRFGRAEGEVRRVIECITGWCFKKTRPAWLKGRGKLPLELDGYNETHQVAFEYQGEQHYRRLFGMSEEDLLKLKARDKRKRMTCLRRGVLLIRIPYWKQDIEAFIRMKLDKAGFHFIS